MSHITFSDFRNNAKKYFDVVEKKGLTIEIYRHGRPVALLAPINTKKSRWKTRQPLMIRGVSLSQTILQEREEST